MMANSIKVFFAGMVLLFANVGAASDTTTDLPKVFLLRPAALRALRDEARRADANGAAINAIRADADRDLQIKPVSVMDKAGVPPSGDKHDYMSLAPYWWPDPKSPNGLPYIRRDGERNPELTGIPDHKNFGTLMTAAEKLAVAYYVLSDERYAQKASELLRTWFLNPQTRMNPNLQYAQAVKGHNDGRGTGLIETSSIGKVVDAVGLLHGSKSWTESDDRALHDWCARFLEWMLTSANGRDEAAAKNNHGSYYDVQVSVLALFTGRDDLARATLQAAEQKRIGTQVRPDGSQPLELTRTKSYHYSVFNLAALFELARLGENVGLDLWSYKSKDGGSIRAALDYLLPYAQGEKKWPYPELDPITGKELVPLLMQAANRFHAPEYRQAALRIDARAADRVDVVLSVAPAATLATHGN